MRVLIADKFEQSGFEDLKALGCDVTSEPGLSGDALRDAIASHDPEILIVRSTKVPADVIAAGESLKGIIRAGAGYDNIDGLAAGERGVSVCNCPGMNAIAVAEVAIGHLINLDRRLSVQDAELRAGRWDKAGFGKARGLKGRSVLVIGTGAIGTEFIRRAQAFGMNVYAQSRSLRDDTAKALGITPIAYTREALHETLGSVDAVSVHVASTPETKGLCDSAFFGAMKDGAFFINTSRGDIVDEQALIDAVKTKHIRAGLDVYQGQPSEKTTDWKPAVADVDGIFCTHHCGASTDQAQLAVAEETVRIVKVFQDNGRFENVVNGEKLASASA